MHSGISSPDPLSPSDLPSNNATGSATAVVEGTDRGQGANIASPKTPGTLPTEWHDPDDIDCDTKAEVRLSEDNGDTGEGKGGLEKPIVARANVFKALPSTPPSLGGRPDATWPIHSVCACVKLHCCRFFLAQSERVSACIFIRVLKLDFFCRRSSSHGYLSYHHLLIFPTFPSPTARHPRPLLYRPAMTWQILYQFRKLRGPQLRQPRPTAVLNYPLDMDTRHPCHFRPRSCY